MEHDTCCNVLKDDTSCGTQCLKKGVFAWRKSFIELPVPTIGYNFVQFMSLFPLFSWSKKELVVRFGSVMALGTHTAHKHVIF